MAEIRVVIERTYIVPMTGKVCHQINGWTLPQIIENWFKRWNINDPHATRDGYHFGNGDKILSITPIRRTPRDR
jgi:hypothetical protein